jgi:hypothetical protein
MKARMPLPVIQLHNPTMKNPRWARLDLPDFRRGTASAALCGLLIFSGCASQGPSASGERYRCEQGVTFNVRFEGDSAIVDSSSGSDVLFRDAGGLTPQQTVFSNTRVKAEFGLGDSGREAVLRYPLLPLVVRCVRL